MLAAHLVEGINSTAVSECEDCNLSLLAEVAVLAVFLDRHFEHVACCCAVDVAAVPEDFEDVNRELGVPMFPHVAATLRQLHARGLLLTIATSRGHQSVCQFIHTFHLNHIISYVVGAEDVTLAKPHAEPVSKTLAHFSLEPADAVVVGDTHFDILMGRNAGCATIGVTYGNGSRQSLMQAGADAIADHFEQIADMIQ